MTEYETLVAEIDSYGIRVREIDFHTSKPCGKCIGNKIYINKNLSEKEKYCVLCEELGHHHLTVSDITKQNDINDRKQEKLARKWGYEKSVGLLKLIEAFESGCTTKHEIANFLNITEKYLEEAISYHTNKYGIDYVIDCYYIRFIPSFYIAKAFY